MFLKFLNRLPGYTCITCSKISNIPYIFFNFISDCPQLIKCQIHKCLCFVLDCPLTINPQKYLPASVRTMLQCKMVENCLGLHCCLDLSFKLPLGDKTVYYNIPFWIKFEPCQFKIDIAFGGFRYERYILNYDWGK